jgi:hypothetical protein
MTAIFIKSQHLPKFTKEESQKTVNSPASEISLSSSSDVMFSSNKPWINLCVSGPNGDDVSSSGLKVKQKTNNKTVYFTNYN